MKYVIMADAKNVEGFNGDRQLSKVNGEVVVYRTVRLLRENGVKDILITSHNEKIKRKGAKRYEPLNNTYDGKKMTGYWLDGFALELLTEPICYLYGDCYYSENAIKTIVEAETDDILFFCTRMNNDSRYFKKHDEPLGFKVVNFEHFKTAIEKLKKLQTNTQFASWHLFRYLNGVDVYKHEYQGEYMVINDESNDIDNVEDIEKLNNVVTATYCKVRAKRDFYDRQLQKKRLKGDIWDCTLERAKILSGGNEYKIVFADIVEMGAK